MVNRVDSATDRLVRAARRDGVEGDTRDGLAADALAALVLDGAGGRRPRGRGAEVVVVCDLAAFRRGGTVGGERCHVVGGGAVPVSVARDLVGAGAFLKAVTHRGRRIDTVAHFGRYINAELLTVLNLGDPPLFAGRRCVDCGKRYSLERDHVDPLSHHGPTSYDNLADRCKGCHWEKTGRDRKAGLLDPHPKPTGTGTAHPAGRPAGATDAADTANPGGRPTISEAAGPADNTNPAAATSEAAGPAGTAAA